MTPLIALCLFIVLIDCSGLFLTGRARDLLYPVTNDKTVEESDSEVQFDVSDKGDDMDDLWSSWDKEEPLGGINEISLGTEDDLDEESLELWNKLNGVSVNDKSRKDAIDLINQIYGGADNAR